MCVYCYVGDHPFKFDPPWEPDPWPPTVPRPVDPMKKINPWSLERLKEYEELLKRIKALEDQIGCPCEPNKADYLEMFRKRIEELEKKINERR